MGGVQAGADWQFAPNWVLVSKASTPGSAATTSTRYSRAASSTTTISAAIGSITGRVGWTWGPGLVYVKGGYAFSDNNETLTFGGLPVAFALDRNHRDGYTIGAGVEYMFAPNWSAKAEYQYYNFGDSRFLAPAALVPFGSFQNDEHTLKAGINYRFNFGAPVAARY